MSNITGWSRGLEVSGGGRGVVSHAGLALLRHLADKTGLAGGLSRALATPRMLVHDRGRVLAGLASTIHSGASSSRDRRVSSLIRSRACCMALSAGQRARNVTGLVLVRPRERTSR